MSHFKEAESRLKMVEGKILRSFLSNFGLMLIQPDKQLRSAASLLCDQISLLPLWNVIAVEKWFKEKESSAKVSTSKGFEENSAPGEKKRTVVVGL